MYMSMCAVREDRDSGTRNGGSGAECEFPVDSDTDGIGEGQVPCEGIFEGEDVKSSFSYLILSLPSPLHTVRSNSNIQKQTSRSTNIPST